MNDKLPKESREKETTIARAHEWVRGTAARQDLKKYKDATHHFEKFPHYFEQYIPLMNKAASQMFTVDGTSKWSKQKKIWSELGTARDKWKMARDLMSAWRVMK